MTVPLLSRTKEGGKRVNRTLSKAEEPQRKAIEKSALRGTFWTLFSFASGQILRFVTNVALARLLAPELFGLMAIVSTVLLGLSLFSDIGLQYGVTQSAEGDDPDFLNTTWTLQCTRGFLLWLVTLVLAAPVASFYGHPEMRMLVPVAGLSALIQGFNSTNILSHGRHMNIAALTRLGLIARVIQISATVFWAWVAPSPWALVGGSLIGDSCSAVLSHLLLPGIRNKFLASPAAVRKVLSTAKWTILSTALMFLAAQTDRLELGKLLPLKVLGIYGIAYSLSDIPRQIIVAVSSRIGLPFLSKFAKMPRAEFRAVFVRYRWMALLTVSVFLAVLVNSGDVIVNLIYDKRYRDAAWMIPIFAVGLWHTLLYSTSGPALMALGHLKYNVFGYLGTFLVLLLIPPVYSYAGLPATILLVAFSDFPMYLSTLRGQVRESLTTVRQDLVTTLVFVFLVLAGWALRSSIGMTGPFFLGR